MALAHPFASPNFHDQRLQDTDVTLVAVYWHLPSIELESVGKSFKLSIPYISSKNGTFYKINNGMHLSMFFSVVMEFIVDY